MHNVFQDDDPSAKHKLYLERETFFFVDRIMPGSEFS
jgi:hypothetical protein